VTVVTDNFITLLYGLELHRSFIHSRVHHQLTVTRLTSHVTLQLARRTHRDVYDTSDYVKDACRLNPKAASTLTTLLIP